ncbi:MAG TPA: CreA family protein [Candidatus Binataceae bacterium]|nr:CreA family protein [Candidatus Binataceae bacterium]
MREKRKAKRAMAIVASLGAAGLLLSCRSGSETHHTVGSVNTAFKLIGPDHKIIIESYDDPKIEGITVFISKSQTGGIKGAIGLAEDTSDASVAVRQTGPIRVKETFENGEDAFTEKRSVLFKRLHVSRFWDAAHKSFVYLVWTDRLVNGSPHNSISAVVAQPWGTQAPDLSLIESAAAP